MRYEKKIWEGETNILRNKMKVLNKKGKKVKQVIWRRGWRNERG